jgi:hypothetical protein
MSEQTYTIQQFRDMVALADDLGITRKHDPASTTLQGQAYHGPLQGNTSQFGLFARPGVRPEMFQTLAFPRSFLGAVGINQSRFFEENLAILTGQLADSGTNATGFCGDPPGTAQLKTCEQQYKFGKYYIKTDLNAIPETGLFRNRADVPRNILNMSPHENPLIPEIMFDLQDSDSQLRHELFRIGSSTSRSMERVAITGDNTQASASTEHGWISEFDGLDTQIKTGYADRSTGTLCPAADSAVITFGVDVGATISGGDGRNIVTTIADLYWGLQQRAMSFGMDGTQWVWVMRPDTFRAIVEAYACQYQTYRCDSNAGGRTFTLNEASGETNRLRLEMMNGQYLLIDGTQVPVVFSEGIPRENVANATFFSDIYCVPMNWQGLPLIRMEYFPMNNPNALEYASFADADAIRYLNNGMYIVGTRDTPFCREYHFGAKFRLILDTPFLAGRIDDINYTFRAPIRDAYPGGSFYADGGDTYTT